MKQKTRYVILTPARNEDKYIAATIESVVSQTIVPDEWVIIDDGSIDDTGRIIDEYAGKYPWIRALHRDNRGFRKSGGGVMETFYYGLENLRARDWDYIVKLDADLTFSQDYFEKCFEIFERETDLGIGGGGIYQEKEGVESLEGTHPLFHVRGATKIYRKKCWEDIDGLVKMTGWDTLDEVKANMKGWRTKSFFHLKAIHHKFTGSADGAYKNLFKNGMANYISGYHPLFMVFKCLKRLSQKPCLTGSVALLYGFLSGYIINIPQVNDRELIKYLRNQQMRKLTGRNSIWK